MDPVGYLITNRKTGEKRLQFSPLYDDQYNHDRFDWVPVVVVPELLSDENAKLRQIISDCAAALPNGAFISPEASVEFMAGLPEEIRLVVGKMVSP